MKKVILSLLLLIITLTGYSQSKSKLLQDTIVWGPDYELSKSDFQAKAKKGYVSYTVCFINLYTREVDGDIKFVVEAVFSKSKSFLVENSEYELKHERGHFNICEIYARKLRQRIMKKNFLKVKNIRQEITEMYKQINEELKDAQEKYDNQTEHSMNMAQQKKWDEKILSDLKELDDYISTDVTVGSK